MKAIPAKFFLAVILILIGCFASLFGSWEWQRTLNPQATHAENHTGALAAMVVGILFFGLGCMLAAVDKKLDGPTLQSVVVLFIMTPLPSILALAFNQAGFHLRVLRNSTAQTIVSGLGLFLLSLGGMLLWQDYPPGNPTGFRDLLWTVFVDFGLALVLLAAAPALAEPEAAFVEEEEGTPDAAMGEE